MTSDGEVESGIASGFPKGVRIINYGLAAFLTFGMVSWTLAGQSILSVLIVSPVVLVLVVQPIKAKTTAYVDRVEVRTALKSWTVGREEVIGFKAGILGPVIVLKDGRRLHSTAPIPHGSWLAALPRG